MKQDNFRLEHIGFTHKSGIKISDLNFGSSSGKLHCLFSPSNRSRTALYDFLKDEIPAWSGEIIYNGKRIVAHKGRHNLPLEFIREQIELFPEMSVGENILGNEADVYTFGCLNDIKVFAIAQNYLRHFNIRDIKVDIKVKELSHIDKRIISILRAVANNYRILFIEDSLTSYNSADIKKYIDIIKKVVADGVAVVLVTDRLNEFVFCSDHISVVRSGTVIYHTDTQTLPYHELLALTKSKDASPEENTKTQEVSSPIFSIHDNNHKFRNIMLYPSEILGIYDPDWEVASGIIPAVLSMICAGEIKQSDLGIITEDDCLYGIFNNMSLYENISLNSSIVFDKPFGIYNSRIEHYIVNHILISLNAEELVKKYSHFPVLPKLNQSEQMTVIIARRICAKGKALIFINPYISFNDSTVAEFNATLKILRGYGYSSIIISKNKLQLERLSNRIEDFS